MPGLLPQFREIWPWLLPPDAPGSCSTLPASVRHCRATHVRYDGALHIEAEATERKGSGCPQTAQLIHLYDARVVRFATGLASPTTRQVLDNAARLRPANGRFPACQRSGR